jgi:hypothetical protein
LADVEEQGNVKFDKTPGFIDGLAVVGTTLDVGQGFCGTYGTGSHVRDAKLGEANGTEADHEVVPRLVTTGVGKALEADDTEGSTTGRSDEVGEVKPDNNEPKPADAIDVEADEITSVRTGEGDKSVPEQLDRLLLVSRGTEIDAKTQTKYTNPPRTKNIKPKSSSQCEKQYASEHSP